VTAELLVIFGHVIVTNSKSAVVYQMPLKLMVILLRYGDFTIFQMADLWHH